MLKALLLVSASVRQSLGEALRHDCSDLPD
jgi:hypothetical protein